MDTLDVVRNYGYWIVFTALALESTLIAGLIVPGIGVLVLGGFLSGLGELDLSLVLLAGYLGTLTGDNGGYALARIAGERIEAVRRVMARFVRTKETLEAGYPQRYLFFQFPMPLRVAFPVIVGAMRRPFLPWLAFDVVATALFVGSVGCTGYLLGRLGRSAGVAQGFSDWLNVVFIALFAVWATVAIGSVLRERLKKRRRD